ncbi:MAG: tRNA pseudouridine(55) synthase TruB [Phycisphaerales bacterium]|nr:tRNA pseudouridine(55) synthase TruB [Phycisphaerales bacterium]
MKTPSIEGFLVLDKPYGLSSMKALSRVRVLARDTARGAKTGHAGTLDPLATGILVIGVGRPATRLLSRVMAASKRYRTEVDLSAFSPSDDLEREPEPVAVETPPDRADVERALLQFHGHIQQAPPAFSAIKVDGRRAYLLARDRKLDALPDRPVHVRDISLVDYEWPVATIDIHCGKGFYVRSLARDLGVALDTGGYCRAIRRTAVGPFTLDVAWSLADLPDKITQSDLVSIDDALDQLKAMETVEISPDEDAADHRDRGIASNPASPGDSQRCDG